MRRDHCFGLLAAIMMFLGIAGCANRDTPRPMSEMQGECGDYRIDIARELALARGAATPVRAAAASDASLPLLPLERKLEVGLHPQPSVQFRLAPERRSGEAVDRRTAQFNKQTNPSSDRFAGLLQLRVPQSGRYQLSTGIAAWLDVITANAERLQPASFEMQRRCTAVFKAVVFELSAGTDYTLQVSASHTALLTMYVVPR